MTTTVSIHVDGPVGIPVPVTGAVVIPLAEGADLFVRDVAILDDLEDAISVARVYLLKDGNDL